MPPTPEDHAELALRRETVRAALASLDGQERDLIALKFAGGLSNAEIARVLGMSESNAGTRLHRTITKLREACHDVTDGSPRSTRRSRPARPTDDDPLTRELQELALALRADAPEPDAEFRSELGAQVVERASAKPASAAAAVWRRALTPASRPGSSLCRSC